MGSGSEDLRRLREAIGSLVSGDVSELLAQARGDARARVRATLAEVMAEEMLEQARNELGAARSRHPNRPASSRRAPAGRPAPPPPHPAPPLDAPLPTPEPTRDYRARYEGGSEPSLGYYVYGVTAAAGGSPAPEVPGVDGAHPLSALPCGDLAAMVSRVPLSDFDEERLREHLGDIAWVETIARRHEEVLEAIAVRATVIPMRLCTIYREASGVRAMLERESVAMHDALHLLEGRSEWGVKVFSVGPPAPARSADAPGPEPAGAEPASGAAYLEQRRQDHRRRDAVDEELAAACESIHDRLSSLAVRARIIPPQRPEVSGHAGEMILSGVYLVDDTARGELRDAVAALANEFGARGIELQSTGPWPAYNFVPDAIGASP